MPKIYVAFQQPNSLDSASAPTPLVYASGSMTTLKQRVKDNPDTEWTVAVYAIKPDVATICQIIESVSEMEAETAENFRVSSSGNLRKIP